MACLTPFKIRNPRPNVRGVDLYIKVPCNKCTECLKRRARSWLFRLSYEKDLHDTSAFVTLTYNDDHLFYTSSGLMTLDPRDFTLFMKRLRKANGGKVVYYMCGEYGGDTERPHHHMIIYGLKQYYIDNPHRLEQLWQQGHVRVDPVTDASIAYVVGYVNKQKHFSNFGELDDRLPEYSRMSKGIGLNYLTDNRVKHMKRKLNPYIVIEDGKHIPLPRYYRDKVFSDSEKRILQKKAIAYADENPQFETPQRELDVIDSASFERKKRSRSRNKL